jgi:malate permease and related proteins
MPGVGKSPQIRQRIGETVCEPYPYSAGSCRPGGGSRAVWLSGLRSAVCISVAAAAGVWFGLDPVAFAVLIVQVSTPVAVTSYMMAEKYGADAPQVAGLVIISTLLSVITLPITLAFLM